MADTTGKGTEVIGPFEYRFAPSPKSVRLARQVLALWLDEQPIAPERAHDLLVACAELCANALKHGASDQVVLGAKVEGEGILLEVHDDGRGFTLSSARSQPDLEAESGRGLHLVKSLTDRVEVRCDRGATVVRAYKEGVLDLRGSGEDEGHLVREEPPAAIEA